MSSYIDWRKIHIESTDVEGVWQTMEDFFFPLDDCSGKAVLIKAGFPTDGASIPKIFWNVYDPLDIRYRNSAILHDGLYRARLFPRDICDNWLYEAMVRQGCSWWTRTVIYKHVDWYGGSAYNSNSDASIAEARKYVSLVEV